MRAAVALLGGLVLVALLRRQETEVRYGFEPNAGTLGDYMDWINVGRTVVDSGTRIYVASQAGGGGGSGGTATPQQIEIQTAVNAVARMVQAIRAAASPQALYGVLAAFNSEPLGGNRGGTGVAIISFLRPVGATPGHGDDSWPRVGNVPRGAAPRASLEELMAAPERYEVRVVWGISAQQLAQLDAAVAQAVRERLAAFGAGGGLVGGLLDGGLPNWLPYAGLAFTAWRFLR